MNGPGNLPPSGGRGRQENDSERQTGPLSNLWIPNPRSLPRGETWAVPGVRTTDPDTSADAAVETGMVRQAQRMRLLAAWREAGMEGLTDEEAAKACGLWGSHSCWWRRASDLRQEGRIEATKERRKGEMGRPRMVSVIATAKVDAA